MKERQKEGREERRKVRWKEGRTDGHVRTEGGGWTTLGRTASTEKEGKEAGKSQQHEEQEREKARLQKRRGRRGAATLSSLLLPLQLSSSFLPSFRPTSFSFYWLAHPKDLLGKEGRTEGRKKRRRIEGEGRSGEREVGSQRR
jgi:hypothetical protein